MFLYLTDSLIYILIRNTVYLNYHLWYFSINVFYVYLYEYTNNAICSSYQ